MPTFEEKMTDVRIATELINDAWRDRYDIAIVVSRDSDLVPPIETVLREFAGEKQVFAAFPPGGGAQHLKVAASMAFYVARKIFRESQLPDVITRSDGTQLIRPAAWS